MDVSTIVITTLLTALISATVGAIVTAVISFVKSTKSDHDEKTEAQNAIVGALAWREIKSIHHEALANGGLPLDERKQLEIVYEGYRKLGFNGTGEALYNEAKSTKVIE